MSPDEAEDFVSWAQIKILENDYARLRKFQGRSKLSTFLTTVLQRLFLDYRNAKWGKWRPSAAAKRLGRPAILLERLVGRDGLSEAEAIEMARFQLDEPIPRSELEGLLLKLPRRVRPRREGEERLRNVAAGSDPGADLEQSERRERALEVAQILQHLVSSLEEGQKAMIRLRYREGVSVAEIARLLQRDQRKLYSDFDRLTRTLRDGLEEAGIRGDEVRDLLGWDAFDVDEEVA